MTKILKITRFGNDILRTQTRRLSLSEIMSPDVQTLITNMRHTAEIKQYGVGLAAPQVGQAIALSIIAIKPTPTRPKASFFETVIINPEITETFGKRSGMWEGCISCGKDSDTLYGKALRYRKIRMTWHDDEGALHDKVLEGLPAHVAQHEIDHLNGILFVDRVRDTKSYMMIDEYKKMVTQKRQKKSAKLGKN